MYERETTEFDFANGRNYRFCIQQWIVQRWTGEQGAHIDYPMWVRYGKGENDELRIKSFSQLRRVFDQLETDRSFEQAAMSAICKFGSNHMAVAETAHLTLLWLEREHGFVIVED